MKPEDIRALAAQFQASRILLTAFELGLFTALGTAGAGSEEIARRIGTDARATDRLMNALTALGLLEKRGMEFWNTPAAGRFLSKDSPDYLPGLGHTVHLWDSWSTLTSAVRAGTGTCRDTSPAKAPEEWLKPFIAAMHDRAIKQAPDVAAATDLTGVRRLLDVGGGPGTFSMAFIRRQPGLTATVFDLPEVIPLTQGYIKAAGLQGSIDTAAGDYITDPLPTGYDMVYLSAIIHSNPPSVNELLVAKCTASLNLGGRVVIQDWIMDESRTTPLQGALFALNMLVGTAEGDTYTEHEVMTWMTKAGLSNIMRVETRAGTAQMIGTRKR